MKISMGCLCVYIWPKKSYIYILYNIYHLYSVYKNKCIYFVYMNLPFQKEKVYNCSMKTSFHVFLRSNHHRIIQQRQHRSWIFHLTPHLLNCNIPLANSHLQHIRDEGIRNLLPQSYALSLILGRLMQPQNHSAPEAWSDIYKKSDVWIKNISMCIHTFG